MSRRFWSFALCSLAILALLPTHASAQVTGRQPVAPTLRQQLPPLQIPPITAANYRVVVRDVYSRNLITGAIIEIDAGDPQDPLLLTTGSAGEAYVMEDIVGYHHVIGHKDGYEKAVVRFDFDNTVTNLIHLWLVPKGKYKTALLDATVPQTITLHGTEDTFYGVEINYHFKLDVPANTFPSDYRFGVSPIPPRGFLDFDNFHTFGEQAVLTVWDSQGNEISGNLVNPITITYTPLAVEQFDDVVLASENAMVTRYDYNAMVWINDTSIEVTRNNAQHTISHRINHLSAWGLKSWDSSFGPFPPVTPPAAPPALSSSSSSSCVAYSSVGFTCGYTGGTVASQEVAESTSVWDVKAEIEMSLGSGSSKNSATKRSLTSALSMFGGSISASGGFSSTVENSKISSFNIGYGAGICVLPCLTGNIVAKYKDTTVKICIAATGAVVSTSPPVRTGPYLCNELTYDSSCHLPPGNIDCPATGSNSNSCGCQ